MNVSTHSRPKAAGHESQIWKAVDLFQHTAARRRLEKTVEKAINELVVSTHSRPKAAGSMSTNGKACDAVSTHSRPKAAGKNS